MAKREDKRAAYFKKYGKHQLEVVLDQVMTLDWPKPVKDYTLFYTSFINNIEVCYFWAKDHWESDQHVGELVKVTDLFSAAESSAFFGVQQQRLGIQQDKVSQFLATIGKMVKELFQLVRELRILDERLSYYEDSMNANSKSRESAEITLKGIWIDLVEQGGKNPASVYGLARELQFTTLPDLFFSVHPAKPKDVDKMVNDLHFNRKVKEVLKRKLRQFVEWKSSTHSELKTKRVFTLKYLRQHFNIIKMYMHWVKPYLKNIRRLTQDESRTGTPDIVAAFESSVVEVEFLAISKPVGNKHVYSVVIQSFEYFTKPSMSFQQEGYNRGPVHVGHTRIYWRWYFWTREDIEAYLQMREEEDMDLLGIIDGSVKAALEALGDELQKYLKEAGERYPFTTDEEAADKKKDMGKEKPSGLLDPFSSVFKGFGDALTSVLPKFEGKPTGPDPFIIESEKGAAKAFMQLPLWNHYKNFKKTFKFLSW